MLKMSGFEALFSAVGNAYLLLALVAISVVLWKGKTLPRKFLSAALVLTLFAAPIVPETLRTIEYQAKLAKAEALFGERCKTAGEKILKTVEDVESIQLINPRARQIQGVDEADPNWSGAGLARESTGSQYIANFLFYDIPAEGQAIRTLSPGGTPGAFGSIAAGVAPRGTRGYGAVEVDAGGERVRYRLRPLSTYTSSGDPLEAYALRESAAGKPPRYAVSYENIPDPIGRANWIAGARVKVLDQQSGETLAELVQFSFEPGFGSKAGFRQPWGFARQCAPSDPEARQTGAVRYFTQRVLKPLQR
jgi:hypothetical protein